MLLATLFVRWIGFIAVRAKGNLSVENLFFSTIYS